jgi:hypothetical protein
MLTREARPTTTVGLAGGDWKIAKSMIESLIRCNSCNLQQIENMNPF